MKEVLAAEDPEPQRREEGGRRWGDRGRTDNLVTSDLHPGRKRRIVNGELIADNRLL